MSDKPVDPFEARGLESLYRERARWGDLEQRIDRAYRRRVQEAIERLEFSDDYFVRDTADGAGVA